MRILMISAFYDPYEAGAEIFTKEISRRLIARGHEVHLVTGKWNSNQKNSEVLLKDGIMVHRIPCLNRKLLRLNSFIFSSLMHKNIFKFCTPDIIHSNLCFSAGIVGTIAKKETGAPLIVTIQGGDIGDYEEHGKDFKLILQPFINYALENANKVHVISKYLAKNIPGKYKSLYIPSGVDFNQFSQPSKINVAKKYNLKKNIKYFISVSRLTKKNGLDTLIRAFTWLQDNNSDAELLIVGDGEESKILKCLASNSKRIHFLGNVPHEDIPGLLQKSFCFVRPSINEGFGIAFLEAMAAGTLCIGSKVGGIPEVIGKCGYLVPPNKPLVLANTMEYVLNSDDQWLEKSEKGKKLAKQFDWEIITDRIEKMYREVLYDV